MLWDYAQANRAHKPLLYDACTCALTLVVQVRNVPDTTIVILFMKIARPLACKRGPILRCVCECLCVCVFANPAMQNAHANCAFWAFSWGWKKVCVLCLLCAHKSHNHTRQASQTGRQQFASRSALSNVASVRDPCVASFARSLVCSTAVELKTFCICCIYIGKNKKKLVFYI